MDYALSDEYERVPLKQRLKLLLANKRLQASSSNVHSTQAITQVFESSIDTFVKKEDEHCDSQNLHSAYSVQERVLGSSLLQQNISGNVPQCFHQTEEKKNTLHNHMNLSTLTAEKVDAVKITSLQPSTTTTTYAVGSQNVKAECVDVEAINSKKPDDVLDDLDFVVLKERQRILLSRKEVCLKTSILEDKTSDFSSVLVDGTISQSAEIRKGQLRPTKIVANSSRLSDILHVKVEPLDNSMVETTVMNGMGIMPHSRMVLVKGEVGTADHSAGDELDHMLLRERMKLFSSRWVPSLVSSVSDCTPISSAAAKPLRVSRPRKRRKTATDSVEVAMEEDAPGLLQVLLEKGISVDEIKLYGENESNELIGDLSSEESFSELEAVISKLFSQRQSLLKLAPLQCTKGEKASYCLACLFSLVEQARYLHFRNWPVEWGWCRDLQSFIFVFERHNRIVLERPEYGYATYFFELVDSSPIDWQIRRLVTAMKLTSCSRINLIENRTLTVGEELSEGEERVLMAYGWVPNTGLGTMLNYRDRVVHDRKTEKDSSEWRSKIGKLLVDGYNGGSIVDKLVEYNNAQSCPACPKVKLELD